MWHVILSLTRLQISHSDHGRYYNNDNHHKSYRHSHYWQYPVPRHFGARNQLRWHVSPRQHEVQRGSGVGVDEGHKKSRVHPNKCQHVYTAESWYGREILDLFP